MTWPPPDPNAYHRGGWQPWHGRTELEAPDPPTSVWQLVDGTHRIPTITNNEEENTTMSTIDRKTSETIREAIIDSLDNSGWSRSEINELVEDVNRRVGNLEWGPVEVRKDISVTVTVSLTFADVDVTDYETDPEEALTVHLGEPVEDAVQSAMWGVADDSYSHVNDIELL